MRIFFSFIFLTLLIVFANKIQAKESDTIPNSDMKFDCADKPPYYPGGSFAMNKFIKDNLLYPKEASEKKIQGKVKIQFIVNKDGYIGNIKVLEGIGYGCDEAAIEVVKKMPRFKPGKCRSKKVAVQCVLPINFTLE